MEAECPKLRAESPKLGFEKLSLKPKTAPQAVSETAPGEKSNAGLEPADADSSSEPDAKPDAAPRAEPNTEPDARMKHDAAPAEC
jgi:hypothetical protein